MKVRLLSAEPEAPIEFSFSEKKAVAAAAVLLNDSNRKMRYLRLIKLLYLADRESIRQRGRPIVGGHYFSMEFGPVTSEVLDLIRHGGQRWDRAIQKHGYEVRLKVDPGVGPLSEEEISLLRMISRKLKRFDRWTICRKMHELPEWEDPGGGSLSIPIERILDAFKFDKKKKEEIRQQSVERIGFDRIFGI